MMTETQTTETEVVSDVNLGELICHTWDGRGIYMRPEEEVSTDAVIAAQSKALKGKGVDVKLLTQLMVMALFTVDGEAITIDMLTKKPNEHKEAIGWKALGKVQVKANEINQDLPTGKT